jgi:autotransporter-associated beta strand protein
MNGGGTLTLSSANTYTGATNVNGGVLNVNAVNTGAGAVSPVTAITAGLPSLPTGYQCVSFSLNGSDGLPGKGFLRDEFSQP